MSKRILILEDEKDIGRLYSKCLMDRGYDPVLATDGLEGLRLLKEAKPDLILLDLGMPNMNGIEFYQYTLDYKGRPMYPILVLTGRTDLETLFKDFNVEGFILKPFSQAALVKEVEIIFNKQNLKEKIAHAPRIMIADNDQESAQSILEILTKAGYRAEISKSGLEAAENIMADPPDMAVINLNLPDITGDLVILKLQGMTKTKYIKYVLYVPRNFSMDAAVKDQFAHKSGVKLMFEYSSPVEIVQAVENILKEKAEEEAV